MSNHVTRGKCIELKSPCISLCYWFSSNLINCTTFHSDHKCYFLLLSRETVLWKLVQIIFRKDTVIVKYVLVRSLANKSYKWTNEKEKHLQNKSYDALREELSDISFCCYNGILFGWPAGQPAPNDFISCFPIIGLQINTSPVLSNDISDHLTNSFAQVTFLYQHHKKETDGSISSNWEEWPNKLMSHELNSFLLPSISSKAESLKKIK